MKTFDFQFEVPARSEVVRQFHHGTDVLRTLTPPPTIMQVHSMDPLGEGSVSRFTIWAGPIPLRWEATHRGVTDNGFTDVQTDGPMESWAHTHTFTEIGEKRTRVTEHIEFEHRSGPWGFLTRVIFSPPALRALFEYRKFQTIRHCR